MSWLSGLFGPRPEWHDPYIEARPPTVIAGGPQRQFTIVGCGTCNGKGWMPVIGRIATRECPTCAGQGKYGLIVPAVRGLKR